MDFRERLLKNDIRCLAENLKAVSDELMLLRDFVNHEFRSQFNVFLKSRDNLGSSTCTASISSPLTTVRGILRMNDVEEIIGDDRKIDTVIPDIMKTKRGNKRPQLEYEGKVKRIKSSNDEDVSDAFENELSEQCTKPEVENVDDEDDSFQIPEDVEFHVELEGDDDVENEVQEPAANVSAMTNRISKFRENIQETYEDDDDSNDPDFIASKQPGRGKSRKAAAVAKQKTVDIKGNILKVDRIYIGCPICKLEVSNAELATHIAETHTEEETESERVCRVCGRVFDTDYLFTRHKERAHKEQDESSGRKTKSTGNKYIPLYVCEFCKKTFPTKYRHEEHERTHTGEKPYDCPVCQRCFANHSNLTRHFKLHEK